MLMVFPQHHVLWLLCHDSVSMDFFVKRVHHVKVRLALW